MTVERRQTMRRESDRRWPNERAYRDVWLFLLTGIVLWATIVSYNNSQEASDLAVGNRKAIAATCAATSAVIDAGRATLKSGAVLNPPEFRRALEQLGLPKTKVRIIQSEKAAREYGRRIALAVEQTTGRRGIARKDGTLDCRRLTGH